MPSKSKENRLYQRQVLEKQLDVRLEKLAEKGASAAKIKSDSQVKKLKAKIREANIRIAAFDKSISRTAQLAQAKEQKMAELAMKKAPVEKQPEAAAPAEVKPKKKAAAAQEGEAKKKKANAAGDEAPKKPRKKKEETAKEE